MAPEQIALGNGAAELLQAAALALLGRGDELVMPWPSYPLYPLLAAHAGARPGERRARAPERRGHGPHARGGRVQPERPDAEYMRSHELGAVLAGLPAHVHVLLDEALVRFQDAEDLDSCLRLTYVFPRLLVVRTFSKIYGLSGLRAGYAVSSDTDLLAAVAPVLGVNALTQAAVEHALRTGDAEIEAPPPAGERGAGAGGGGAGGPGCGGHAVAGELPLGARPRPVGRRAGAGPAPPGRAGGARRPFGRGRSRPRRASRRGGDAAAGAGVRERRVTCVTRA